MPPQYQNLVAKKNFFNHLDRDCSLYVLGFCLASNDIVEQRTLIDNTEPEESSYHFAVSLSILREVAKIIGPIETCALKTRFSQKTSDALQALKRDLQPDDSLTHGTLRHIRNNTSHYNFTEAESSKIDSILTELKNAPLLRIRANSDDHSALGHRYSFADIFRNKLVNAYLTKEKNALISAAACNVIQFTESLLVDLLS